MIEFCKTLVINVFWVLAAVFQVGLMVLLIIGILGNIIRKLTHKDEEQ